MYGWPGRPRSAGETTAHPKSCLPGREVQEAMDTVHRIPNRIEEEIRWASSRRERSGGVIPTRDTTTDEILAALKIEAQATAPTT